MLNVTERELRPANGYVMLFVLIFGLLITVAGIVFGGMSLDAGSIAIGILLMVPSILLLVADIICFCGLKALRPNEAYIFTLFGKYYGTLKESGFYWINPFVSVVSPKSSAAPMPAPAEASSMGTKSINGTAAVAVRREYSISTKIQTLVNDTQKVNDLLGNPIIIGAIVVWKVVDPTRAVFMVDDYREYLSSQADSIIRNVARLYPYDVIDDKEEVQTLRASAAEIAERMQDELQAAVKDAGLEVIDVRLNQLSYAPEIAAAMLQRQQAVAVIAARQKIVEGAVSMVRMALDQLKSEEIVDLDDERKAQMVSNLLVVLCGNKDAQPVLNSGSIY